MHWLFSERDWEQIIIIITNKLFRLKISAYFFDNLFTYVFWKFKTSYLMFPFVKKFVNSVFTRIINVRKRHRCLWQSCPFPRQIDSLETKHWRWHEKSNKIRRVPIAKNSLCFARSNVVDAVLLETRPNAIIVIIIIIVINRLAATAAAAMTLDNTQCRRT